MKRWIVIVILILLLLVSFSTCSINSCTADRDERELAEAKDDLAEVKDDLAEAKSEHTTAKTEIATLQDDYEQLHQEYTVLQTTKEMVFNKGVRLFDIQWGKGYWGILEGKVQNISDKPMKKVEIIVASYNQDGSLNDLDSATENDLFPQEIAEWSISGIFLEHGSLYEGEIEKILAIYAFGNRDG